MLTILIAAAIITGIGLVCGLLLVVADKFMAVPVDETETKIRECLPGANCGACGYTGCDGYAKALAADKDGTVATNLCVPGADAVAKQVADVMGREALDVIEMVAVVACDGDCNATKTKYEYQGVQSCAAVKMHYGSNGLCTFGCIGMGDCAAACPNQAICLDEGVAHVNANLCSGCGMCAKTCPQHLIHLMPDVERVMVTCSNHDKGAQTRKACSHGCIGCKKCEKNCPNGAVTVVDNLATIDYSKCTDCKTCAVNCPVGAILVSDFSGIHRAK